MRMKIASAASAFDQSGDETAVFKAVRRLSLEADTIDGAEFLAKLHACFRHGKSDKAFMETVDRVASGR